MIRINDTTKEWEVSTDNGATWTSTGVSAEGTPGAQGLAGDSFFKSVDTKNAGYVIFTLADGTEFKVNRFDEDAPLFAIKMATASQPKSVPMIGLRSSPMATMLKAPRWANQNSTSATVLRTS